MNVKDIEYLIKFVQKSGVAEVSLEQKDFKITIKTGHTAKDGNGAQAGAPVIPLHPQVVHIPTPAIVAAAPPAAPAAPAAPSAAAGKTAEESKYLTIKSPMIGTFYRS